MSYVVDTHALIWHLTGNKRLSNTAKSVLSTTDEPLYIPAIGLVEAAWLVEHGRTSIPSVQHLVNSIQADSRFRLVPLDEAVISSSFVLTAINEIHDRQIVATTLWLHQSDPSVLLITHDQMISASGLVPVLW